MESSLNVNETFWPGYRNGVLEGRRRCGLTRKDKVTNEEIRTIIEVKKERHTIYRRKMINMV